MLEYNKVETLYSGTKVDTDRPVYTAPFLLVPVGQSDALNSLE